MRRTIVLSVLVPVISLIAAGVALAAIERFSAMLNGGQEVPRVMTTAEGTARITKVNNTRATYVLRASRIDNVVAAHIHRGRRGMNGPIVVSLRRPADCTDQVNSFTCRGTITRARLTGPLRGRPLIALVREMRRGNTYVNVHTTGFPDGEIRGQIRRGV